MKIWRRHPRAWVLFHIVLASTSVFWLSQWDLVIAGWFQRDGGWLLDAYPLWKKLLYDGVQYLVVAVVLGTLISLILGSLHQQYWLRRQAAYVLLVFVLGPGLVVNTVLKDHWGRPRPVQVEQFGGAEQYAPPGYVVAAGKGRSFPSGHSSVGFAFIAFWFLWRRNKPQWARLALWGSLALGTAIGITRMAAGGHFLSDVLWSAWAVLGVAWLLYHTLFREQQTFIT